MICLTYDTDYMTPEGMRQFFDTVPFPGQGTFFLWKPFPATAWHGHEIQPHPYVADLTRFGSDLQAFSASLELPHAPQGVRTHSCVYSHMVGIELYKQGYRYASMTSPLYELGLRPYRHPWGIWEMPIYYMDNMDFCTPGNWPELAHKPFSTEIFERALDNEGLYVFDFHPLHIALNTTSYEAYQDVKAAIGRGEDPFSLRMPGRGVATYFNELCEAMDKRGVKSVTLSQALDHHLQGKQGA
ncbi:polysaccharide deacetylase WbmS family protein [Bordetella hinzii]|uniref:Polysaccharide deacetylase n=1 Tax=Bordetella hinzii TaxID=103855 RepID=A0AAN1RV68_9BORD|nr:hypothetical protein [Bordetella hinzii]AKQ58014.1 hypothetical protein ACR55_00097 [Bordetella hinzii]AZW16629.1 hypothetical protein CS347_07550 [Bordetella hinzii]KCB46365.1 hypothetical protein L538_0088 [Bordetella hinzii 4161]KXA73685.1 hypothetical protein AXA74_06660 [Bordetella hinzii LMG 13501]MBZ0074076.1 hypothetical protein [Bordetella hinzii]